MYLTVSDLALAYSRCGSDRVCNGLSQVGQDKRMVHYPLEGKGISSTFSYT